MFSCRCLSENIGTQRIVHLKWVNFTVCNWYLGLPWWLSGKESACQCRRQGFNPWVGKIPWTKNWQPSPVFLSGKSHGRLQYMGLQKSWTQLSDWTTTSLFCFQTFHISQTTYTHLSNESLLRKTSLDQKAKEQQTASNCFILSVQFRIRILLLTLGWAGPCGSHQPHFLPNCLLFTRPHWCPFWKWPAFPHPRD